MKKLIYLIFTISIVQCYNQLHAQNYIPSYLTQPNDYINQNFEIIDSSGWFYAKSESNVPFTNFIQENKAAIGMGADDDFILTKTTNDDYPFMSMDRKLTHHRYYQTYKGIEVEYAQLFLHHKNNRIEYFHCKVAEGLNISVTPSVTENQALTNAIGYLGSSNTFSWQDSTWEAEYKDEKEDSTATTYPTGELVIAKLNIDRNYASSEFVLAWKFEIQIINPFVAYVVYVNANTGNVIKLKENSIDGNAQLSYNYGNKFIDTKWRGGIWGHYILQTNDIAGRNIWTKKARYGGFLTNNLQSFGGNNVGQSFDQDDIWWGDRSSETNAHWAMTQSWDFFLATFLRNSLNNNGSMVKVLTNVDYVDNVFYPANDEIHIGIINGNHLGTIDLCGHEYSHGVIKYAAELESENEPGALNESYADIFGFEIERFTQAGVINDWEINEDVAVYRRMNHPSTSPPTPLINESQPSVYHGPRWHFGTLDEGGIHHNAGVQNYWYYLLSQGSAGAPDGTFNNIAVSGIGADNARNIAYHNLDVNLGQNSNYNDSRNGAILSAMTIYGNCSNEAIQTINAWAAVGIGNPVTPTIITGPGTLYYYSNGQIFGSLPKNYVASGGILLLNYIWQYTGPWQFTTNGIRNQNFTITDFVGNYNGTTLQVNSACESISKAIKFNCIDCGSPNGFGNPNNGELTLNPNPAGNDIHIQASFINPNSSDNIIVTIVDMNGIYQFQQNYIGALPETINIASLVAGNYILIVHQGDKLQQIRFTKK